MNDEPGWKDSRSGGLVDSAKNLLAKVLAIAETRLDLFSTELEEEIVRLVLILSVAGGALFCLALGALLVVLFIVAAFWDSYRLLAIGLLAGAWFAAGAFMWLAFLKKFRAKPRLFTASIRELAKDREELSRL